MLKILQKFFKFCKKDSRKKFYVSLVYTVIQEIFGIMKMPAIYVLVDAILKGTFTVKTIWQTLIIMAVSIIGQSIVKNKSTLLQTEGGYQTCADKRIEIAEHMRYVPMGYFNKNSLGQVISVSTNTLQSLENIATRVIMTVTAGLINTVVIVVMLLAFDWRVGLITLAGIGIFFIANTLLQKRSDKLSKFKVEADTNLVDQILEYVQGITEVKGFNLGGKRCEALNKANDYSAAINYKMEKTFVPLIGLQNLIIKLTGAATCISSILFYINSAMELSTCIVMIIASFMMLASLDSISGFSSLLRTVDLCVDQVNEVLEYPVMKIDGEKDSSATDTSGIELKNVDFSYDKRKIIDGISVNIPLKTTTAIVGPSGGGKTTLTQLISRFWDVDSGEVLLNGKNVRSYNYDDLMKNFSFVFQNVYLFKDTIANNIRFGTPEASMEKVIEAAKKACCHDFIMSLPKGYDTVIGDEGLNLSGGERQRISIARAIMKDSPIIILDEATANVDPESEAELIEAINELTKEKTIIMIAHRLKTVRNANQILVINNGKITQKGTHTELIGQEGIYKNFIEGRKKAVSWKL